MSSQPSKTGSRSQRTYNEGFVMKKNSKKNVSSTTSIVDTEHKKFKVIQGKKFQGVERIFRNVAGVDIGATLIYVAIVDENDTYEVREFGTATPDLLEIAKWLKASNVQFVPMEATGVYWIPLFEILQDHKLSPVLIDPKRTKNMPGKKTDVLDCQWIHTLYSCGLLPAAFIPPNHTFRAYMRERGNCIKIRQRAIMHMNKALLLMNIKLDTVSEVISVSGMDIIRAIVAGERDPKALADLRHYSCKKNEKEFIAALTGNFQDTHLFSLKQALDRYDHIRNQIGQCDEEILKELMTWETVIKKDNPLPEKPSDDKKPSSKYARSRKPDHNEFSFDIRKILFEKTGVDLIAINALGEITVATIISEIGGLKGLTASFSTAKRWGSWLGLAPGNNISGGKNLGGRSKKCKNRIKTALCMAATSLAHAKCSLGAYYRRMSARMSKSKAVKAVAHKLALLVYRLLTNGNAYVAKGQEDYEKQREQIRIKQLKKNARDLGFELVLKEAQ